MSIYVVANQRTSAWQANTNLPDDLFVQVYLSTREGGDALVAATKRRLGSIDINVHGLGGSSAPGGGFAVVGEEHWQRELDLNLFPAMRMDRALLPQMLERRRGL